MIIVNDLEHKNLHLLAQITAWQRLSALVQLKVGS